MEDTDKEVMEDTDMVDMEVDSANKLKVINYGLRKF